MGHGMWSLAEVSSNARKDHHISLTRRNNRPRADSAPVLVVTSPSGSGTGAMDTSNADQAFSKGPAAKRAAHPLTLARRVFQQRHVGSLIPAFSPLMSALSSAGPGGALTGLSSLVSGADSGLGDGDDYGTILDQALSGSVTNTGTSLDGDDGDVEGDVEGDAEYEDDLRVGNGAVGAATLFSEMEEGDEDVSVKKDEEVVRSTAITTMTSKGSWSGRRGRHRSNEYRGLQVDGQQPPFSLRDDLFAHRPIPQSPEAKPQPSALTLLFNPPAASASGPSTTATSSNPFFSSYVSAAPPQNSTIPSVTLEIYFPHSTKPSTPLEITVRKDVTVEEVIGWALANYWDRGLKPRLDDGLEQEGKELERQIRLSTVGWALRIVEDDGEVDEDFPGD